MSNQNRYTSENDVRQRLQSTFIIVDGKAFYVRETSGMNISGFHADMKKVSYNANKSDVQRNIPRVGYVYSCHKRPELLVRQVTRSPIYSISTGNSHFWNPQTNDIRSITMEDLSIILQRIDSPTTREYVDARSLFDSKVLDREFAIVKKEKTNYAFLFNRKNCVMTLDTKNRLLYYYKDDTPFTLLKKIEGLVNFEGYSKKIL